jgi:hypothetical protein
MAKVAVEFGELVIEREELDDFWAMRSQLEIPLAHVRGATVACATDTPLPREAAAVLCTGCIVEHAGSLFWGAHDPERTVVITLAHARYQRLVIAVDDPDRVVARINRCLDRENAGG